MAYYIYCDGGSKDNQSPERRSGYGSFVATTTPYPDHASGKLASKFFTYGKITNNQAEYRTLLEALNYCIQEFLADATIYTDSELVVSQLNGGYKVRDPELKTLHEQALKLIQLVKATVVKAPRETIFAVLGH